MFLKKHSPIPIPEMRVSIGHSFLNIFCMLITWRKVCIFLVFKCRGQTWKNTNLQTVNKNTVSRKVSLCIKLSQLMWNKYIKRYIGWEALNHKCQNYPTQTWTVSQIAWVWLLVSYFLAIGPWTSSITFLHLCFHVCKMEITTASTLKDNVRHTVDTTEMLTISKLVKCYTGNL